MWRNLMNGALKFAHSHALRNDATACAGNLAVALIAEAHARFCERGEWYLPEKDMVKRAGLKHFRAGPDSDLVAEVERVRQRML